MTGGERETLLQALGLWRRHVEQMTSEQRVEAALADLIVMDGELEGLRTQLEQGEIS
jgi:hypothetical protein